jgi:putative ABC transport system permease protein
MNDSVQMISLFRLALSFVPVVVVLVVLHRWSLGSRDALLAVIRMLVQLVLVGYVLTYIFAADQAWVVMLVLVIMLTAASWITLRPLTRRNAKLYLKAGTSIALGGGVTLALVTQGVLDLEPWFWPRYMIPLAGMIFANAMNTVSLAAERYESEAATGSGHEEARTKAMRAALIPVVNSLLAVGLVSLPGMMTGQILSGVSPLVAARYQIMVMSMVFGASGLSTILYLWWLQPTAIGDAA